MRNVKIYPRLVRRQLVVAIRSRAWVFSIELAYRLNRPPANLPSRRCSDAEHIRNLLAEIVSSLPNFVLGDRDPRPEVVEDPFQVTFSSVSVEKYYRMGTERVMVASVFKDRRHVLCCITIDSAAVEDARSRRKALSRSPREGLSRLRQLVPWFLYRAKITFRWAAAFDSNQQFSRSPRYEFDSWIWAGLHCRYQIRWGSDIRLLRPQHSANQVFRAIKVTRPDRCSIKAATSGLVIYMVIGWTSVLLPP